MNKLSVYESFDHLPQSYKAFFDDASTTSVFLSLPWFAHLSKAVFPAKTPAMIYVVESEAGIPRLILPAWSSNDNGPSTGAKVLASASNYYTPLFSPLVPGAHTNLDESCAILAHAIMNARPRWDIVNLQPMDPHSTAFASMMNALRAAGMWADSYFCFGNWYLDVGNRSYRDYCRSLPSRLLNTLARKEKQANRAGRLKMAIVQGGPELHDAIAAYETVYNASWKIPEAYPEFMPGLIRLCAEHGWLRLGVAYLDDQPVAAQVWIVSHGVASIFKLAYDQRYANLSVGSLLTARLMEHVIDTDRVTEVDFLSGDDQYKSDWMSGRRERHGIIAFNPRTLRGSLGALRHFGARAVKNAKRRIAVRAGA